jgi:hypothetical protein
MKVIRALLIIIVVLVIIGAIGIGKINVDVIEDDLPTNVYEEDADLLSLVNIRMISLFVDRDTNEYGIVEEIINLIILDSIRENVNSSYDPLSDCETEECNFIIHEDNYYLNFVWAELSDDNQLIIHVSVGTEKFIDVNTIFDFYFDIDIDYLGLGIELTLDSYNINDIDLSMSMLDNIFEQLDIEEIESNITKGELDLTKYSYKISFSIIPFT